MCTNSLTIPSRRFGRTEIDMPILSLGGMRFQQSWEDLDEQKIVVQKQQHLEETFNQAIKNGLHHVETARHYGTSEMQLGWAMKKVPDRKRLLQSKVPPRDNPKEFEQELELSLRRLQCQRLDLLAIHGINLPEHLDQTIRPGGCLEVARRFQSDGRVGHIGFSTHGPTDLIIQTIETDQFDYVNLHWYFIYQNNERALAAAEKHDLGVFIISPTDKGGHLHTPSEKLLKLCAPLHPIVFNDLFCLSDKRVHTISVGASQANDLDLHLEAINLIEKTNELLPLIIENLHYAQYASLGKEWLDSWFLGLPSWKDTPGRINIPVLLWLHNLLIAWDMESYAKARYQLLGNGGHWFPGANADCLDIEVQEEDLKKVLVDSPWGEKIPDLLRELKVQLGGSSQSRLLGI